MNTHEIINLYTKGLKSMSYIANKFSIDPRKVKNILQSQGVTVRTRAQQNTITNQERGKKVNHDYFNEINSLQKAWVIGFLAARGAVGKDNNSIKIGLSSTDREILEKIKVELGIEREIHDSETNRGFQISQLEWSSANQKTQLQKYGVIPNKTYHPMRLPDFKADDLKLAYLLGYFDGDGCFKNDGKYCRFEICSYRIEILESFSSFILERFGFKKKVLKDKSRNDYYTLTYSTQEVVEILGTLYKLELFSLQRKKEKYMTWKNSRI